ncbi:MAG: hypothetical protein GXP55_12835 [Deltaproteobacteria bacterium]|nr:hypothetical protein [Deltaproteobacteria bacterium]
MRPKAPTVLASVVLSTLTACYASHRSEPASTDAATPRSDARFADASAVVEDASVRACGSSDAHVEVTVERVGSRACDVANLSGQLTHVSPAPDEDGVRFEVDLCPDADDDCRCAITVAGVGSDLAGMLGIAPGPFRATWYPTSIALFARMRGGEVGDRELAPSLYAEDSYLDRHSYGVAGVLLSAEEACRVHRGAGGPGRSCDQIGYAARLVVAPEAAGWADRTTGGEARLVEGETTIVEGTLVTGRLLRSHEVFCAPTGSPHPPSPDAAFVLWWNYPPAP